MAVGVGWGEPEWPARHKEARPDGSAAADVFVAATSAALLAPKRKHGKSVMERSDTAAAFIQGAPQGRGCWPPVRRPASVRPASCLPVSPPHRSPRSSPRHRVRLPHHQGGVQPARRG